MNALKIEDIVSFIQETWQTHFSNHKVAPKTLLYNPSALLVSGMCHIAHSYVKLNPNHDPDNQICTIIESELSVDICSNNIAINNLDNHTFECIVFVSSNEPIYIPQILNKVEPNGLVIIINKCITLFTNWTPLYIDNPVNSRIEAFIKTQLSQTILSLNPADIN